MERLLRRTRRVALTPRESRQHLEQVESGDCAAELTYIAVVGGVDLWVSAHATGPGGTRLACVHRHRKDVRLLPAPDAADLAGQNLPPDSVVAACGLADLFTDRDTGTWDLAVIRPGEDPELLGLSSQAQLYPADPVTPAPRPDGVVVTPYRTRDGRGAINVGVAPPSVEVESLVTEADGITMALRLCRWSGPNPAFLVLDRRRGHGRLAVPLQRRGERLMVMLPADLLAEQVGQAATSVWDVAVEGPGGRTPCGRTSRDVGTPRRVYRYAAQHHASDRLTRPLVVRPYFTNDRTLALEVDGVAETPPGS